MKKYLSIFLIFFLLFGVSVPAFASTNTPIPPALDSISANSFAVLDAYLFDPFEMDDPVPSYACFAYDSSDWQLFHIPDNSTGYRELTVRLISYSDNPSPIYYSNVPKSSYDTSLGNNGWTFEQMTYNDTTINGQIVHTRAIDYSFKSLDYYDPENNTLTRNPFLLSNLDIYNGSWSSSTGADISNEVFFSPTPPLVVETQKALTQFQTQTIQTIMIIVLCGVGCLALLISLPLLRKVLLRFLNK